MKIIFCLPGNRFSGDFMLNFINLLQFCKSQGIKVQISQEYSSMVNFARCKCAGADVNRGKKQKPFNGLPYDYMMWIDSDIIFNNESFTKLISLNKDIASGWYAQPGGSSSGGFYTPVVEEMNDDFFANHGSYQFLTTEDMSERKEPFIVDYIGFGWALIKQGVFESMNYPWFAPKIISVGENQEVCSEDVSWCQDAKEAGYKIWLDPTCRVGHEKIQVI